jgi:acetyltransferase-like isoleucine patch superfamily enzyme
MNKEVEIHKTIVENLKEDSGSALKKYQSINVGKFSLLSLFKYELVSTFVSPLPGAAGYVLRKFFFKSLIGKLGRGSIFGKNITLRCPGQINIGDDFVTDNNVVLDSKGENSGISIGDSTFIGNSTIFSCASAHIKVGNNVSIGPNCYIRASRGNVTLGSFITIGPHTVIISGNPDYKRLDIPMMNQEGSSKGISIGDDVWIGVGVRIIDGVKIGNGCVLGAGAVVTSDIPDYSIAAGVPAKVVAVRK